MKLIVKLPLRRKSERLTKSTNNQDKDENENKKPSKERVRFFRERLKHNSKKLAKYKNKKKQENKTYKAKIKAERKENHDLDEMVKERQRIWKQKSRKLEAKKKKLQKTSEDKDTTSITKNKRRTIQVTQASTRKRVQRVRQLLPESPGAWANTVSHLIKNATPRRKSKLMSFSSTAGKSADLEKIQETLQINKVGRPTREIRNAKKHLAFSSSEQLWKNGKIVDMYKKRKLQQVKRLSKPVQFRQQWRGKLEDFLEENSRVMPNKKDTVLIDGKRVAKRHLLSSKLETYKKFKRQNNNFKRKFTTFNKMVPKNFKCLNLSCRRVCICTKDYNMEQKVDALNRKVKSIALTEVEAKTAQELSDISVCKFSDEYPARICIDRKCNRCGTHQIKDYFEPLITHTSSSNNDVLKYNQWETRPESYTNRDGESRKTSRWMQVERKERTEEVVKNIEEAMESYTGHIFRAKFQNRTQASLIATLPIDHCLVVMDYLENMTLQPQDEIESAHFTQKQITLFPIYIVRHSSESTNENPVLSKESLVILSDHLVHNASAVYVFTNQLLIYLRNSPGPSVKVIHRFSDNCATQFKCKDAFSHLFLLEDKYDIKINYHYTEAGHGKGPSDGIGAGIKRKLELMILAGKVINNAYQAYLALRENQDKQNQQVIYIPVKKINQEAPKKNKALKTVKGTQALHMVRTFSQGTNVILCRDLSCPCAVCILHQEGPCLFGKYRHDDMLWDLNEGRPISTKKIHAMETADVAISNSTFTNNGGGVVDSRIDTCDSELRDVLNLSTRSHEEHAHSHNLIFDTFKTEIAKQGWQIRGETPEDGNCCFWAISDQLDRQGKDTFTHIELRKKMINYFHSLPEAKKEDLKEFLTTDISSYLANMNRDGTYADHICLEALSQMLSCNILVVHSNDPNVTVGSHDAYTCTLVLGYLTDIEHYVSLEPLSCCKPEDFVAVHLSAKKKNNQVFVAKVLQVDEEIQVRFLKQVVGGAYIYTWPVKDEMYWQSAQDIIKKLSQPTLLPGRGLRLLFSSEELEICKRISVSNNQLKQCCTDDILLCSFCLLKMLKFVYFNVQYL